MENRLERLKYFMRNTTSSVYIDKNIFPNDLFDDVAVKINSNCTDLELYGDIGKKPIWFSELSYKKTNEIVLLKIDLDNSTKVEQRRFLSIIKDKTIGTNILPDNCKILIFSSNKENIDNEIMGLLVVI